MTEISLVLPLLADIHTHTHTHTHRLCTTHNSPLLWRSGTQPLSLSYTVCLVGLCILEQTPTVTAARNRITAQMNKGATVTVGHTSSLEIEGACSGIEYIVKHSEMCHNSQLTEWHCLRLPAD